MSWEEMLQSLLNAAGVSWRILAEAERAQAETQWRAIFGQAFLGRSRMRQGARADFELARQASCRWLIVPLRAGVAGTPINPRGRVLNGYECEGVVVPLGALCGAEFAVSPVDLSWAMLYTHEDYALGGPYFVHQVWLGNPGFSPL